MEKKIKQDENWISHKRLLKVGIFTLIIIYIFHFRIICNKMARRIYEIVTKFVNPESLRPGFRPIS